VRALHLRTSSNRADQLVERWLRQHGVEVLRCADAWQACLSALQRRGEPVELAFVGLEWLAADELAVLHHVREAWPRVGLVIVACAGESLLMPPPRTIVCRGLQALRRLLSGGPDQLLQRFARFERVERRPLTPAMPASAAPPARSLETELPREIVAPDAGSPAAAPGHDGEPPAPPTDNQRRAGPVGLTPEEVAALLQDDQ